MKREIYKTNMDTSALYEPLISIVVPVYNGEQNGLKSCLLSLLRQTYRKTEIIVVDDCSTDLSYKLAMELLKDHRHTIVRHEVNKGLSETWNDGIDQSKGEYLLLIQQDCSLLTVNTLEKAINRMLAKNEVFISGNQICDISSLNFFQKIFRIRINEGSIAPLTTKSTSLTENKCDIVKKNFLLTIGKFNTNFKMEGQDFFFSMELKKKGIELKVAPELEYTILYNGENAFRKLIKKEYKYGKVSIPLFMAWKRGGFTDSVSTKGDLGRQKLISRMFNVIFPAFLLIELVISIPFRSVFLFFFGIVTFLSWIFWDFRIVFINNKTNNLDISIFRGIVVMLFLDTSYFAGTVLGIHIFKMRKT